MPANCACARANRHYVAFQVPMRRYRLPGTDLHIANNDSPVDAVLHSMFRLCPAGHSRRAIVVTSCLVKRSRLAGALPPWLRTRFPRAVLPGPIAVYGPMEQVGVCLNDARSICCAWYCAAKKRIHLVAVQREPRQTSRARKEQARMAGPAAPAKLKFVCGMAHSISTVLVPVLREVLLSDRQVLLHGGAVIMPNGVGALLLAPGGGGKTTTVLSVVRKGARLLADDLLAVNMSAAHAVARGIPEPLNVSQSTAEFFPELQSAPPLLPGVLSVVRKGARLLTDNLLSANGAQPATELFPELQSAPDVLAGKSGGKKMISPLDVYGRKCFAPQTNIRVIYSLALTDTGPSVRRLSVGEGLKQLIQAHIFAGNQKTGSFAFALLCRMLANIRMYELRTGPSPDILGAWLITQCANHAGEGAREPAAP